MTKFVGHSWSFWLMTTRDRHGSVLQIRLRLRLQGGGQLGQDELPGVLRDPHEGRGAAFPEGEALGCVQIIAFYYNPCYQLDVVITRAKIIAAT